MTRTVMTLALATLLHSASTLATVAMLPPQAPPAAAKAPAPLAGTWSMTVESPHGMVAMSMTLEQDGTKVAGTLSSGMGDRKVKGEYTDAALQLQTIDDPKNEWVVSAKLTAAGGLNGHVSASVGDMPFKAQRAEKK